MRRSPLTSATICAYDEPTVSGVEIVLAVSCSHFAISFARPSAM